MRSRVVRRMPRERFRRAPFATRLQSCGGGRLSEEDVVVPEELSNALLFDSFPSTGGAPMNESIVDVEEMRPCCLALMGEEEPVREVRRDQMWKLARESDHCGVGSDRNNNVNAVEFDQ